MNSVIDSNSTEYETTRHNGFYTPVSSVSQKVAPNHTCTDVMCVSLAVFNVIIMVLGIIGNGLVIWIAGFRMKKTINTVWYLSLAVSDFLYCAFLPLSIVYVVKKDWIFGSFMCKSLPFFLYLNWFNSIFVLLLISVDRCIVVIFPVWAQNKRTIHKAWALVLAAWIVSALLSWPATIFYKITNNNSSNHCICKYKHENAIVLCRFILLFAIPFLIIVSCYALIIRKLKYTSMERSKKPFKVMTALIAAFFICWMPYHIFYLLEINLKGASINRIGRSIGITLAGANSFINPILYAFMGKDFCRRLREPLKRNTRIHSVGRFSHSGESKPV